jgi:D-sedoheptulose 7-phosphate isomerase
MKNIKDFSKNYFNELKKGIDNIDLGKVQKVTEVIFRAYKNNKQIFILGNGGSASTASHFACDLGKGTLRRVYDDEEKRFKVVSLTDNVTTMTAFGNDVSFEDIFYQQLRNFVNPGDVVIGISGSGNSLNVIKAIQYAKKCGATTVGFLGFKTGGKLSQLVDYEITVQDNHYGRIEDIHLMLVHSIAAYLTELKKDYDPPSTFSS